MYRIMETSPDDFGILIIRELAKHGYCIVQDMKDDLIDELYYAIYGYHPDSVFSTSVRFKNGTIVFYFIDDVKLTGNQRWAVGITDNNLLRIPTLPSKPENNGVAIGKIKWVIA